MGRPRVSPPPVVLLTAIDVFMPRHERATMHFYAVSEARLRRHSVLFGTRSSWAAPAYGIYGAVRPLGRGAADRSRRRGRRRVVLERSSAGTLARCAAARANPGRARAAR